MSRNADEEAVDDRRRELYIDFCMPPPPWIRWPEQYALGLEWKLAVLEGQEPALQNARELRRLRCALEWEALSGWAEAKPVGMKKAGTDCSLAAQESGLWEPMWEHFYYGWGDGCCGGCERQRRSMEFDSGPGWGMGVHGPKALLPAVADATCMSRNGLPIYATKPAWPKDVQKRREGYVRIAWPTYPHYATLCARCEEAVARIRARDAEFAAVRSELIVS